MRNKIEKEEIVWVIIKYNNGEYKAHGEVCEGLVLESVHTYLKFSTALDYAVECDARGLELDGITKELNLELPSVSLIQKVINVFK